MPADPRALVRLLPVAGTPGNMRHFAAPWFRVLDAAAPAGPGMGVVATVWAMEAAEKVLWQALADPKTTAVLQQGGVVVLDGSREGLVFDRGRAERLVAMLCKAGFPGARLIVLTQNEQFVRDATAAFGPTGVLRSHAFHFHLRAAANAAQDGPRRWNRRLRPWTATSRAERVQASGTTRRRFLSMNRQLREHRLIALGRIFARGLQGRGLVSCIGFVERRPRQLEDVIGKARLAFPAFGAEIDTFEREVAPALPLTIPGDTAADPVFGIEHELFAATDFSLVVETEMSAGENRRFTEKSLKPLAAGHPAVVAGNAGALAMLRGLGFRTFAPWIDEGYDRIEEPAARLSAVLAEFERLAALPQDAMDELTAGLAEVTAHNARHFTTGLPEVIARQDAALADVIAAMLDEVAAGASGATAPA